MSVWDWDYCRLCAQQNQSGVELDTELISTLNRYLPLKIQDNGKLPRKICPGCHIQLQATVSFFDLIVEGQKQLKELRQTQILQEQKLESLGKNMGIPDLTSAHNIEAQVSLDDLTKVMELGDGLYWSDHAMSVSMDVCGENKPKRKRGRPRKDSRPSQPEPEPPPPPPPPPPQPEPQQFTADGKIRRKRKVPVRYQEGLQGKELDRIFREEGVYDEFDYKDRDIQVTEMLNGEISLDEQEIIGHVETKDGQELGDVVLNRVAGGSSFFERQQIRFQCEICGQSFNQQTRFLEHKALHTSIHYQCGGCSDKFTHKDNLELHQRLTDHTGQALLVIDIDKNVKISDEMSDKANKEEEVEEEDEVNSGGTNKKRKKKKYCCPICRKQFHFQTSLKGHMLASHKSNTGGCPQLAAEAGGGDFACDICGKKLRHPSSVVYHKETEHNNGRRFVCSKCGKSFKHRQLLRRHQLVHSEKRPYYCKQCSASFKTKANLLNHQSTHTGVKKFFCELCGNQFAHKTSLTLHYRWHTGSKPYQCDVCKKCFSQKGNLQEHVRIHTGEKPFVCEVCNRRFTTSSQFKLHSKRHTGERPFNCNYCDKSFLHRDTWKCHIRRHRGEKPFRCSYCSRDFSEMWALRKHLRLHTGERPYTCPICAKAFADCSNLKKHKKVHAREQPQLVQEEQDVKLKKHQGDPLVVSPPSAAQIDGVDFWNMIRTTQGRDSATTPEVQPADDTQSQVDTPGDAQIQQLIYVTYQDQADTSSKMSDKYFVVPPGCDVGVDVKDEDDEDDEVNMAEPPSMQVTDEQGNPIHFTLQDGTQLQVTTPDGKSLQVTTTDGQVIPVRLTTAEGQPLPAELTPVQTMPQLPVTHLVADDGGTLTQIEVSDNDIEFVSDDNQQVRMLTALTTPASIHIPSPFLTIG